MKLMGKIEDNQEKMFHLRQEMRSCAKENNTLEREVLSLDKRIHSALQDHIKPSDLRDLENTECKGQGNSLLTNREVYEKMFCLLQKNPRYFALIAQEVVSADMDKFVNMIIFDLYGDQFDKSEERLLLTLFREIMEATFKEAGLKGDLGSLFRANTPVTLMLSSYSRRREGLKILKKVLEEPLRYMISTQGLNLEVNAYKVYQEVMVRYEKSTNKQWPWERVVTSQNAWKYSWVRDIINPRIKQLRYIAGWFLDRIFKNVEEIPYGMRWICKQLAEMGQKYFPKADRYQIGSILGGYLFLRFFNPVIVNPGRGNLLSGVKLTGKKRNNLVLVAKILQHQANGAHFRGEEMKGLNDFLDENKDIIQRFFQKLIDVDNLEEKVEVDDFMENFRRREPTVTLRCNQIYLVHRLIWDQKDKWKTDNDLKILEFVSQLGDPPKMLDRKKNFDIVLKLHQPDILRPADSSVTLNTFRFLASTSDLTGKHKLSEQSMGAEENVNNSSIWESLRSILLDDNYPCDILNKNSKSLLTFLNTLGAWAHKYRPKLFLKITTSIGSIDGTMNLDQKDHRERSFNEFLMEYVKQIRLMKLYEKKSRNKLKSVKEAKETMGEHRKWLQQKKKDYMDYLLQVMTKVRPEKPSLWKFANKSSLRNKKNSVSFKHPELVVMGIILFTHRKEKPSVLKKFSYEFGKVSVPGMSDEFIVRVSYNSRVRSNHIQSFRFPLDKLNELQERQETVFRQEDISFSVKELIMMLDKEFGTS